MNGRDSALAINQESGGEGIDSAVELRGLIVADQDPVIYLQMLEKRLDDFPAFIVHGDADYREAFSLMLALKLLEPGNLDFTRTTPGGPEIQQHDFPAVVREVDELAVRILEGKIGGPVPLFAGLDGGHICRAPGPGTVGDEAAPNGSDGNSRQQTECGHSLPSSPIHYTGKGALLSIRVNQWRRVSRNLRASVNSSCRRVPE